MLRVVTPAQASLCVEVQAQDLAAEQGQAATWLVTAWATGGNVPGAVIRLQATPAGSGSPHFSAGCGAGDNTSACSLGTVVSGAKQRTLTAQDTVPLTTAAMASVTLVATGTAAGLKTDPRAGAAVAVAAWATPVGAATLPPDNVPGISSSATLSPGGNASGLFPTLSPEATSTPAAAGTPGSATSSVVPGPIGATPVVDISTVDSSHSSLAPQVAGLAVLGVALLLAMARVSVRRPTRAGATGRGADSTAEPADPARAAPPSAPQEHPET